MVHPDLFCVEYQHESLHGSQQIKRQQTWKICYLFYVGQFKLLVWKIIITTKLEDWQVWPLECLRRKENVKKIIKFYRAHYPQNKDRLKALTYRKSQEYTFISNHEICFPNSLTIIHIITQSLSHTQLNESIMKYLYISNHAPLKRKYAWWPYT